MDPPSPVKSLIPVSKRDKLQLLMKKVTNTGPSAIEIRILRKSKVPSGSSSPRTIFKPKGLVQGKTAIPSPSFLGKPFHVQVLP